MAKQTGSAAALGKSQRGYVFPWTPLQAPQLLLNLLEQDVMVKLAMEPFQLAGRQFGYGSIFVPMRTQQDKAGQIHTILEQAYSEHSIPVLPVSTFRTEKGIDLGSSSFVTIDKPEILLMSTRGVDTYSTGSIWHLLDVYHDYPVTRIEPHQLLGMDLTQYTALILSGGSSSIFPDILAEKIGQWVRHGGTLICLGSANKWAIDNKLVSLQYKASANSQEDQRKPFAEAADNRALLDIKGAIFNAEIDTTHPVGYGYEKEYIPLFLRRTDFLAPSKNAYQSPLVFSKDPLLAGYASSENLTNMEQSAAVAVETSGKGSIVLFAIDPTFRAYWRGTEKLLLNAILFGRHMKP